MRRIIAVIAVGILCLTNLLTLTTPALASQKPSFKLGNEVLFERYLHLLEGKRIGLVTNPTGVNSFGISTMKRFHDDERINLVALFGPEHGLDGQATAGSWVESYIHKEFNIPVYSLYGTTRWPTAAMLKDIDVVVYDIQDIGARSYTYVSTLFYVMEKAKEYGVLVVVLDRPNPVGGEICEGPVLEEFARGFVGVDNMPIAHGMTVGELARFFNRRIGAAIDVVPMEGYSRDMVWQETGLNWVATSPMIPSIESAFGYNATGLGDGTGVRQMDYFSWVGGVGLDSRQFANLLNSSNLPGVTFVPEDKGSSGGARLLITDFHKFNPTRANLHAFAYAQKLGKLTIPASGNSYNSLSMFAKVMGGNRMGQWLKQGLSPTQIEAKYKPELDSFKKEREQYLIYGYFNSKAVDVVVDNVALFCDEPAYIDGNSRTLAPYRTIAQALGAMVHWDEKERSVTMRRSGIEVKMIIGKSQAVVNGKTITIDSAPTIKGNRTMIPLRYAGELLGAFVHWNEGSRMVRVTSPLE